MVVQRTGRGPTTAARRAVTVRGSVNDARRTRWLEAACSVFGHRWTSVRQALQDAIAHERFDRLVVAAARDGSEGLHADISWLLEHAPGEVVVVRPVGDDQLSARRRLSPRRRAAAA